jgi:hypothetical protein
MSKSIVVFPEPSVVLEVIRLAEARAAAWADCPDPVIDCPDDVDFVKWLPEEIEELEFHTGLSEECLAGLFALYRTGELRLTTFAQSLRRYREVYEIAMAPDNRKYAAGDLLAKAPLAEFLRRGLQHFGFDAGQGGANGQVVVDPNVSWSFVR